MGTITDLHLQQWIKAAAPIAKSDGDGLTFTLSAAGTAVWVLRYRHGGRRREMKLGRYPDLSLREARKRAAEYRVKVTDGIDVAQERQRQKIEQSTAWTVRKLVRDFEDKVMPSVAETTAKCWSGYLNNALVPRFGTQLAREVTPDDIQDWLADVVTRGYHAAGNARKAAIALFKHGVKRRVLRSNPAAEVDMTTIAAQPESRERIMLTNAELHAFLVNLDRLHAGDAIAFRLLLWTGARVGELRGAEWTEVDTATATWSIPRGRIKTRKRMRGDVFEVPLPRQAMAALEQLRALACGSRYLLPARVFGDVDRAMDHEAMLRRLRDYTDKLDGCRTVVLHDLRSTFRSHLTGTLGVRIEVAERCLNHRLGGLIEIYDRGDYRAERAEALQRWADHLDALEIAANVVPMRARA